MRRALHALIAVTLAWALPVASPVHATDAPPALTGPVILTVATGPDTVEDFDLAALQALPVTTFETSTIWTEGVSTFTGVALSDLMARFSSQGTRLRATALNDYAIEIPIGDAVSDGPILAYFRDGAAMNVRDKGPLWIVYPYDADPAYRTEVVYSRSIWQLRTLEILP